MSSRKLLISGQHFHLSLSLFLSLSLLFFFPFFSRRSFPLSWIEQTKLRSEFDAKKHWIGTVHLRISVPGSPCRSNRASWRTPGKRWPLALTGQTVNRGHCDRQRFSALPLASVSIYKLPPNSYYFPNFRSSVYTYTRDRDLFSHLSWLR